MTKKRINSKKKGNIFELDIAKEISEACKIEYGKYIRRTPGSGSLICRADIWVHTKYRNLFPYFMELKKRANWELTHFNKHNWNPMVWFLDTKRKLLSDPEYEPDAPVMLIFCKNNIQPLVLIETENMVGGEYSFRLTFDVEWGKYTIVFFREFLRNKVIKNLI